MTESHAIIEGLIASTRARLPACVDFDDVTQECWAACLSALPRFDASRGELVPYLRGVIRRTVAGFYAPRRPEEPRDEERRDADLDLSHLKSDVARIVRRKGLLGQTLEEIAREEEITVSAVRWKLAQAAQRF